MRRIGRRDFWPSAGGGISLPAVGKRTNSSIPPFFGVYPNSYKFGCERVMCHAANRDFKLRTSKGEHIYETNYTGPTG